MGTKVDERVHENKTGKILEFNEEALHGQLKEFVRSSVEETLNAMLDAEADALCGAERFETSRERMDSRAGSYDRTFHTTAGKVNLKMPKLRKLRFESQIIERYKRRESSIEEALIEMYLAGVSVRRVEDITEALWGTRVSPATISNLNKKIYGRIEEWIARPLTGEYKYVYLDGIWLKRTWGGEVRNVSILIAVGVDKDEYRQVVGIREGAKEDHESWLGFIREMKDRGLKGTELFISDCCLGLVRALAETFPEALWQRCVVHFYRNIFSVVPSSKMSQVASMLKAIHAQEDRQHATEKALQVEESLREMKLSKAADLVKKSIHETFSYYAFPRSHWRYLRTNNMLERLMKEIRRRTRVVGSFPDGKSALILAAARLRHVSGKAWGARRYMSMDELSRHEVERQLA